jgi:alpha-D-xyloside xylohydrolase
LHGSSSYRVPWLFDEESVDVVRHFTKLKNSLFPYLFAAAHDARENGWPVMRAMFLEYPEDPAVAYLDRQYMLGSSLLVSPVFRMDNVAEYYLPKGKWTNFLTGRIVTGGRWMTEKVDFLHIPLFVRENSIIPISSDDKKPSWNMKDELTLHLFQITDGADISLRIPTSEGSATTKITCKRTGQKITLTSDGHAKNVRLVLRSVQAATDLTNGKVLRELPEGILLSWPDTANPITFTISMAETVPPERATTTTPVLK